MRDIVIKPLNEGVISEVRVFESVSGVDAFIVIYEWAAAEGCVQLTNEELNELEVNANLETDLELDDIKQVGERWFAGFEIIRGSMSEAKVAILTDNFAMNEECQETLQIEGYRCVDYFYQACAPFELLSQDKLERLLLVA